MKIFILKFAKGGGQIGSDYSEYSASYTPLETEPMIFSGNNSKSTSTKSNKKDDEDTLIRDLAKLYEGVKANANDADYTLSQFIDEIDRALLLSVDGKLSPEAYLTAYVRGIANYNRLSRGYDKAEDARKLLEQKNSLDEVAINRNGLLIVLGEDGLDSISVQEYNASPSSYRVLTNRNLLDLRTLNHSFVFREDIYDNMTGVGMDSIIKKVNDLVNRLGETELNISGYTTKLSSAIKSGLSILKEVEAKSMTVDGLYKSNAITKDQVTLAQFALMAVYKSLNPLEKALVQLYSLGAPTDLILDIISSRLSTTLQVNVTLLPDLNIDGSKKSKDSDTSPETNPLVLMLRMQGGTSTDLILLTADGVEAVAAPAKLYSAIPKANKGPMSILEMLSDSGMGVIVLGNTITFGDLPINDMNLNSIMYDNTGGYMVLLPCITDLLGNKVVDFSVLDEYKLAVKEVLKDLDDPEYFSELIKVLKEKGLDELLAGSDSLNLNRFLQFFVVTGYTTDKVLGGNPKFKDSKFIKEIKDPGVAEIMKKALSSKENGEFDVDPYDKLGIFEFWNGWDDIYKGSVYIPITPNQNSAYMAYVQNIKASVADKLETDYLHLRKLRSFNPNSSFVQ